jgi:hypothetical protein
MNVQLRFPSFVFIKKFIRYGKTSNSALKRNPYMIRNVRIISWFSHDLTNYSELKKYLQIACIQTIPKYCNFPNYDHSPTLNIWEKQLN